MEEKAGKEGEMLVDIEEAAALLRVPSSQMADEGQQPASSVPAQCQLEEGGNRTVVGFEASAAAFREACGRQCRFGPHP